METIKSKLGNEIRMEMNKRLAQGSFSADFFRGKLLMALELEALPESDFGLLYSVLI